MLPTNERPAIILGCANSYQEPQRQRILCRERRTIAHILQQSEAVYPPDLIEEDPETGQFLFDQIRSQQFRWQPAVLHLAGYSEGEYLHFQGGLGEESLQAREVARLVSRLPGLRLVFLNGCATPELLRYLLQLDIPAVLAIRANYNRVEHSPLAFSFYEALSRGHTLRRAFEYLHHATPETVGYHPVSYDLERDDFRTAEFWLQDIAETQLPGGLYVQADREAELDWALKLHENPQPRPQLVERMAKPSTGRRISIGLLLALILVLLGAFSGMI